MKEREREGGRGKEYDEEEVEGGGKGGAEGKEGRADEGMEARGREKIPIETYGTMHHLRSAVNRTRTRMERFRASRT